MHPFVVSEYKNKIKQIIWLICKLYKVRTSIKPDTANYIQV